MFRRGGEILKSNEPSPKPQLRSLELKKGLKLKVK